MLNIRLSNVFCYLCYFNFYTTLSIHLYALLWIKAWQRRIVYHLSSKWEAILYIFIQPEKKEVCMSMQKCLCISIYIHMWKMNTNVPLWIKPHRFMPLEIYIIPWIHLSRFTARNLVIQTEKCLKVGIYFITLGWNRHRINRLYALDCKTNQIMWHVSRELIFSDCPALWLCTRLVLSTSFSQGQRLKLLFFVLS